MMNSIEHSSSENDSNAVDQDIARLKAIGFNFNN
jgi:hypothetical protein